MKLRKFLSAVKNKYFKSEHKIVKSSLCGKELQTINGTIRKKIDQDDAWFFLLAKNNDIIFDIGTNIGFSALLAMVQDPDKEYYMVDPNPLALSLAAKNLIMNSMGKKANYYTAFVSDVNQDKIKFYTVGVGAAGSMFKSHAQTAAVLDTFFWVNTVTVDSLVSFYNTKPDLIKIDVEGAENKVLNGAIELAKNHNVKIIVEMHALEELTMVDNAQSVLDWCEKVNYQAWYLRDGAKLEKASQLEDRGRCHLLLLNKKEKYPEYLVGVKQHAPLDYKV